MINENKSLATDETNQEIASTADADAATKTEAEEGLYSWQGHERTWLLSGASWYLYGAGIALLLLLYALLTQAWTLAILISLLAGIIYLYSQEQSPQQDIVISSKGLYVGEAFYAYPLVKSCWFSFETKGAFLVLMLLNSPQAQISISFKPEDHALLQTILKDYVVIDEFHQDTWLEKLEKML